MRPDHVSPVRIQINGKPTCPSNRPIPREEALLIASPLALTGVYLAQ
jgi:hypothetical protein